MARSVMRTVLVISYDDEDPQAIIDKYSEDTTVEPYIYMRKSDAGKYKQDYINLLSAMISSKDVPMSDKAREFYKDLMYAVKGMSDEAYFLEKTDWCDYDKDGNAITNRNPNAYYKWQRCYQFRLDQDGEEAEFSNPFHLKDGTKAYQAHLNDIDWEREHGYNRRLYENAWDICVNGKEPFTDEEKLIQANMSNRKEYFAQFKDKEQYVRHSTSFFTYGVATSKEYHEVDYTVSDMDWVSNFYDKYIKTLDGNPLLSIYEVHAL